MTFEELRTNLQIEQNNLTQKLQGDFEKRLKVLEKLGKIRSGYPAPTAVSSTTLPISDETYSDLQRSLNRQKKMLSLYRKQFNRTT